MTCAGIEHCGKKSCIELDFCIIEYEKYLFVKPIPIKKRKLKKKKKRDIENKKCQFGIIPCNKKEICSVLGQCLLEHSLVKNNIEITARLAKSKSIITVLKVFYKLKPPMTLRGKLKNYKSRK